jgi:hypothetical protein
MTHNEQVIARLEVAAQAISQLSDLGLTVLDVHLGAARPRLEVARAAACARLGGAWYRREYSAGGCRQRLAAPFCGCQVEWEEPR